MYMPLLRRCRSGWLLLAGTGAVFACGPFFPENALDQPRRILQPPRFHLVSELGKLPPGVTGLKAGEAGGRAWTLELEMAEMRELVAGLLPEAERAPWLARYEELRVAMLAAGDASPQAMKARPVGHGAQPWAQARTRLAELCRVLPEDVRLYLEGAGAWLDSKQMPAGAAGAAALAQAREKWRQVAALPMEAGRRRAVWAAWMLFRTAAEGDKAEQGRWLAEVRRLQAAGAGDCLHLAVAATYVLGRPGSDLPGHEAVGEAEWRRAALLRVVLGQGRAEVDLRSERLEMTAYSDEKAALMLGDAFLRRAQLLHLVDVARGLAGWDAGYTRTPEMARDDANLTRWLAALEKRGAADQPEAGLLAWVFYNAARFDEARRWVALAPVDDTVALALRGKLAAMAGKPVESERWLAKMAGRLTESVAKEGAPAAATARVHQEERVRYEDRRSFDWEPLRAEHYEKVRYHELLADHATAQLAVNDFPGALATFLRTDYRMDAAHVAERLLSVEELLALARAGRLPGVTPQRVKAPAALGAAPPLSVRALQEKYGAWDWAPEELGDPAQRPFESLFHYLLLRRLMREGHYTEAARLAPPDLRAAVEAYAEARRRGEDRTLPKASRAQALWKAAQLHRALGMELFGYEDGPDSFMCRGEFDLGSISQVRMKRHWTPAWMEPPANPDLKAPPPGPEWLPVLAATPDERWRIRHYGPRPGTPRWHYRHEAADLAWKAASLMPDDDEQTARVLCIAGSWLKTRSPQAADRFYQALVRRNPSVPLAQEAAKKRWFPTVPWNADVASR